jgi:hypothetical protein
LDLYAEHQRALALRVRETVNVNHAVLRHEHPDERHGPWSHGSRIEHHVDQLASFEAVTLITLAWYTPEGFVLRDGCHRGCAIYRIEPKLWEIELNVQLPPLGALDTMPGLRGRPLRPRRAHRRGQGRRQENQASTAQAAQWQKAVKDTHKESLRQHFANAP